MRSGAAALGGPAKFAAPVATHVIVRPRLLSRLDAGLDCPVTLVAATAGWGKTLLVGSWVAGGAGGREVGWVNLDAADDDVRTFWTVLATALLPVVAGEAAAEGLRRVTGNALETEDLPGEFARAVQRADAPVALVLNDLHEVRSSEAHAGLLRLVERPLPSLSMIVTTRRDPPWPLQRLRLAGLLAEIRAADLRFRPEEAADLFGQLRVGVTASQLDEMIDRTEGWAAGMRLAALHFAESDDVEAAVAAFSGDDHSVANYLLSEVLDKQSPELVGFLEKVSTVDVLCADLADALTGGRNGAAMLAELAASHLFVQALGRPGRWYRLHRLIIDILRARPMPPRERRDLHRRAAEWFERHDMPLDAVRSAIRGALWPLAADLVGTHLVRLVLRNSPREVDQVLSAVPDPVLLAHPDLATGLAGARAAQGITSDVDHLVDAARARAATPAGWRRERLALHQAVIRAARARLVGDFDAMMRAYREVPSDAAALAGLSMSGTEIVPVMILSNLGTAELWTGDLDAAEPHLLAAADPAGRRPALPHINATAHLALLHCERGALDTAETLALQASEAASGAGWASTPQMAGAYLAMARVMFDRGRLEETDTWLGRLADIEARAPEPHVTLARALVLAAIREAAGDPERALSGLRAVAAQLRSWAPPLPLREQWLMTEAALLARCGDLPSARAQLERAEVPRTGAGAVAAVRVHLLVGETAAAEAALAREPETDPAPRQRVGRGVVGALAATRSADSARALAHIEDALLAAAPYGLRQPFLGEPGLRELLTRRIEQGSAATEFTLDLLATMTGGPASDGSAARRALVEPLTERERTMLRYLASALSNPEIATELYVSVNTVKTHQRAVYRKLGTRGRRDAVRRARELELL
jgi:LuxR family maltose regulon positive regulatory protein